MNKLILCMGFFSIFFGEGAYGGWDDDTKETAARVITTLSRTSLKVDDRESLMKLAAAYVINNLSEKTHCLIDIVMPVTLVLELKRNTGGSYTAYWKFSRDNEKFAVKTWESSEDVTDELYRKKPTGYW